MIRKTSLLTMLFSSAILFLAAAPLSSQQQSAEQYDVNGGPVTFEFKYHKGDRYRILSTVNEDVFVNMKLDHHAVIVNRVAAEVTDTDGKGGATHDAVFMTSEESTGTRNGATFTYGEEYKSIFDRDAQGIYTISDEFFMPTVRDVPSFPKTPVKPGDSWTAEGHEAHDFRHQFNPATPYKIPFTATYTYLGTVSRAKSDVKIMSYAAASMSRQRNNASSTDGTAPLHVFRVSYTMYTQTPEPSAAARYTDYPTVMMGYSDELVYWDAEKGAIDHYSERFRIMMETAYGNIYEFRGDAHAEVTEFERAGTDANVEAVQRQVEELGLDNVTVTKNDKGLTLSIEDIRFKAESAELLESERPKLDQIAGIIAAYPDNDILVNGHTAKSSGGRDPQVLSEERAQTVADYLIELGVKDKYHIFTKGYGDSQPVVPNTTRENRAKNRRVEIIILDK